MIILTIKSSVLRVRPIPTSASIRKWLAGDKLGKLAGQVCMKLCIKSVR